MSWEQLVTNESLDAIMGGLDINDKDKVLAVCGSGDQAFAMLEKASQVSVSDIRKVQLELVKSRMELLDAGKFQEFLYPDKELSFGSYEDEYLLCLSQRQKYFSQERLEIIRSKLGNLRILKEGPIAFAESGKHFTKLYLSNIFDADDFNSQRLKEYVQKLEIAGLMYVVNFNGGEYSLSRFAIHLFSRIPRGLKIERNLSRIARDSEREQANIFNWKPTIYRRVS